MNLISKGLGRSTYISRGIESRMNHTQTKVNIWKLHCATECLRNSLTRRTNPCYCFSDCKILNTNVECYNTNRCNCSNRCEVLKQSIKIKLDKPL
jgi:hypothetical protein